MKISNSKKQLARIISESGGWREGYSFSSQEGSGAIHLYELKPIFKSGGIGFGHGGGCYKHICSSKAIGNWHQTILSRDEYFHLYPAPDADGWIEWKGGECPVDGQTMIDVKFRYGHCATSGADCFNFTHDDHKASDIIAYRLHRTEQAKSTAVGDDETNLAAKEELEVMEYRPSIEQLAADYRAKLEIAQKAREEADAANREANAALCKLEHAGEAIGLLVSPIKDDIKMESSPSLNITDWRDLKVGDIIQAVPFGDARDATTRHKGGWAESNLLGEFSVLNLTDEGGIEIDSEHPLEPRISTDDGFSFRFIRRP